MTADAPRGQGRVQTACKLFAPPCRLPSSRRPRSHRQGKEAARAGSQQRRPDRRAGGASSERSASASNVPRVPGTSAGQPLPGRAESGRNAGGLGSRRRAAVRSLDGVGDAGGLQVHPHHLRGRGLPASRTKARKVGKPGWRPRQLQPLVSRASWCSGFRHSANSRRTTANSPSDSRHSHRPMHPSTTRGDSHRTNSGHSDRWLSKRCS